MDWLTFLGRFHVVVLHLPIGILGAVALTEALYAIRPRLKRPALVTKLWFLGALSAVIASSLGYLLSLSGGYGGEAVQSHLTWGLVATAAGILGWACFGPAGRRGAVWGLALGAFQLVSLTIAGHLGGNLTHGPDYLFEHAPDPVRQLAGLPARGEGRQGPVDLESTDVYRDLVAVILEDRCVNCHNPSKTKGELMLDTHEHLMKGGESGPAVVPGDPDASELVHRITLDPDDDLFMPPSSKTPLTAGETRILEWWVAIGAPSSGTLTGFRADEDLRKLAGERLGLGPGGDGGDAPTDPLGLPAGDPPTDEVLGSLRSAGFRVSPISEDIAYLSVDFYPVGGSTITPEQVDALSTGAGHIAWLNLRAVGIRDEDLRTLRLLPNLTRLDLSGNPITDEGVTELAALEKLRSVNLFGTSVGDQSLAVLAGLPSLERAHLSGTSVSRAAAEAHPFAIISPGSAPEGLEATTTETPPEP